MPDPVLRDTRSWLADHLPPSATVIVACSGGADSLALAVASAAGPVQSSRLVAATVDHGLQPGSAARAAHTAEVLTGIGYADVRVLTVSVDGPGGMEAAARRARYGALRHLAESLSADRPRAAVLLAHTADDQAETVLLGLARGSGPRSIAGMRAWRAPWGRPLLGVRRSDTEQTCRSAGLTPWQDPHNSDPVFTRVRLRREVLPLLDAVLGGGVRPALARTAELMAQDLDALDEIAATALVSSSRPDGALDIAILRRHPDAVVGRVLRAWALAGGSGALTFDHLHRMSAQVSADDGPRQVRIPGLLDVVRTGGTLRLQPH
jgi:tRNA(Ile)-lysidine synthase